MRLLGVLKMRVSPAEVTNRESKYDYRHKKDTGERSIKTIGRKDKKIM
jgi:hypothetical protein